MRYWYMRCQSKLIKVKINSLYLTALQANIHAPSGIAILIAIFLLFKFKLSVIKLIGLFAAGGFLLQLFTWV